MFSLFFIWLLILLISFFFRTLASLWREAPGRQQHSRHEAAPEKGDRNPVFREDYGPPVETFQDPECGVYLPEAGAVRKVVNGQTVYFCSEKCAKKYVTEQAVTERPGIRPEVKPSTAY